MPAKWANNKTAISTEAPPTSRYSPESVEILEEYLHILAPFNSRQKAHIRTVESFFDECWRKFFARYHIV